MTAPYPFFQVIEETLAEVFETLIKQSIGELPVTFNKYQEDECTYHAIIDNHERPLALLYFNFEKSNIGMFNPKFDMRVTQFLKILEKLQEEHNVEIVAWVFGIGIWELDTFKEFRRSEIMFQMVTDSHVVETFDWYDFKLNKDLTMDIDNYIRYQKLSKDEKIELVEVLLDGMQNGLDRVIKKLSNHGLKDR